MRLNVFIGLLTIGFSFAACGADNGKMIEFACSGYSGSSTLVDFPVLVRLAENSPMGFRYSDMASSSSGAELRFHDEKDDALPYEVESWNPSGVSYVWSRCRR